EQELAVSLDRVPAAARDLPVHQLDELSDAMGLVHDEVALLQLQRVDHIAPTARQLLHLAGVVPDGATVELRLAEQRKLQFDRLEPGFNGCLKQVDNAGFRLEREGLDVSSGQPALTECFC